MRWGCILALALTCGLDAVVDADEMILWKRCFFCLERLNWDVKE